MNKKGGGRSINIRLKCIKHTLKPLKSMVWGGKCVTTQLSPIASSNDTSLSCCATRCHSCRMDVSASTRRLCKTVFALLSSRAYSSTWQMWESMPSIVHHSDPSGSFDDASKYVYIKIFTQFTQQTAEWCTSDILREEDPGSSYKNGVPEIRFGSCRIPASARETTFFKSMKSAHFFCGVRLRVQSPCRLIATPRAVKLLMVVGEFSKI